MELALAGSIFFFGKNMKELDTQWASNAFFIKPSSMKETDYRFKAWTSADESVFNSRLGGNLVINPRPQYTRYADIRSKGLRTDVRDVSLASTHASYGMGRFYGRQIQDTQEVLTIRAGLVHYSSLGRFMRLMFDDDYAYFVNTGKTRSKFLKVVGQIIGTIIGFYAFGMAGLMIIGIRTLAGYFGMKTSRFSSFRPEPLMYWSAANSILNNILVNEGFVRTTKKDSDDRSGSPEGGDPIEQGGGQYLQKLHELMPDVFIGEFGVDLFAIATKSQRLSDKMFRERSSVEESMGLIGYISQQTGGPEIYYEGKTPLSLPDFVRKHTTFSYFVDDSEGGGDFTLNPKESGTANAEKGEGTSEPPDKDSYFEYFGAVRQQGADFISFRVDHIKSMSESFSTTVGESEISIKLNSASAASRETRFMLAGGNLGDGAIADAVESTIGGIGEVLSQAASTLSVGLTNVLKGVFGAAYLDFPKVFKNSSISLPTHTFSIDLVAPYNNAISRMINIHVPLSCLLPLVLPLSTGRQSYSSPFSLQAFVRGKMQSRFCMVSNMTIERGINNTPFDTDGRAMGLKVTFTFVDMANIMHMPISTGPMFGGDTATDHDSILYDYLAVLSGLDIKSSLYTLPSTRLKFAKTKTGIQLATSAAALAMYTESVIRSPYISFMTMGASDLITGITPGPANIE